MAEEFDLDAAEIAALTGYSSLTIGDSVNIVDVDLGDVTFDGDTTLYGDAMTVSGDAVAGLSGDRDPRGARLPRSLRL